MASPQLHLHDHPVSSYAQKVRIYLREKDITFTKAVPEGMGSGVSNNNFQSISPRHEVPALVDGDTSIFDSKIILQYLDEKYPGQKPLMPKDPVARAKARMIEEVCDTLYEAINWGMGEVLLFRRAEGDKAADMRRTAQSQTQQVLSWLTAQLGEKEYFNGDGFGHADVCVAPYLNRSVVYGMGPAEGSTLADWLQKVRRRKAVGQTFEEMEQGVATMRNVGKGMFAKGSGRTREYRDHRLDWMIRSGGLQVVLDGLNDETIRLSSWP